MARLGRTCSGERDRRLHTSNLVDVKAGIGFEGGVINYLEDIAVRFARCIEEDWRLKAGCRELHVLLSIGRVPARFVEALEFGEEG